jgi:2-methylcitrate dehydratase PrpD
MAQPGATVQLAEFLAKTNYQDLPAPVIEKAKELIIDQLGVALASSTLSWNRKVLEYVQDMGISGESQVVGTPYRTSVEYAALVNGTFGHGFELDDYCTPCGAHVGCVVFPSALAVGAKVHATGADFLGAFALGAETVIRLGFAFTVRGIAARGFHSTSVYGPFGAAVAAAKLLRLDKESLTYALGIAGSHSSGTTEYDQTGGDIKRLHAGIAGMAGIRAAYLAQKGFTAPPTILEGKNGTLKAFSSSPIVEKLTDSLGSDFYMQATRIKPYACCGAIIPEIDAVRQILAEHPVKPADLKQITVGVENRALSHVGTVGPEPKDITGAQFSSHFSLGLTMVKGSNDFRSYFDAMNNGFSDREVIEVAKKVRVEHDEESEAIYPTTRLGKVSLETKDGQKYSAKVFHPRGSPENPLSRQELEDKFLGLASMVVSRDQAKELLHAVRNLETMKDINELAELTAAG